MKLRNTLLAAVGVFAIGWSASASAEVDYGLASYAIGAAIESANQACIETPPDPEVYPNCVSYYLHAMSPWYYEQALYFGEFWLNSVYTNGPSHPTTLYYQNLADTYYFIGSALLEY